MSSLPKPALAPAPAPVATPPIQPRRPSRWPWLIGAVAVAAGAWWGYDRYQAAEKASQTVAVAVRTAPAVVAPLEFVGRVSGQTSSIRFANLTAPQMKAPEAGRDMVLMKLAPAGSMVKKGQVVAAIDAQPLKDHIDDLLDTVSQAENDVKKREAEQAVEWENLQQNLRVAKSALDKAKLDAGAAELKTSIDRELLKLSVEEAEATYKELLGDLATQKKKYESELTILRLTAERHRRHRTRHQHDLEKFTVQAPMDGLVVMDSIWRGNEMAQIQQGDRVFPGQRFMKIVDTSTMQVEGSVNQAEVSDFKLGQPARIKLDAFPGLEFNGKVYSIGALAPSGWRQSLFIRSVPIRVQIQGSDPKLIPDLSASADVRLAGSTPVLQVPIAAVQAENGKQVVYVKKGDGFERREVQTGMHDYLRVAISSGVQAGEEVALSKPPSA